MLILLRWKQQQAHQGERERGPFSELFFSELVCV